MKKIIALAVMLVAGVAAFADESETNWEKSIGLSTGITFSNTKFTLDSASGDMKSKVGGLSVDFANADIRSVYKNNISVMAEFACGHLFAPTLDVDGTDMAAKLDGASGTHMNLFAGIGYRFKLSDRFSLTPSFVLGFDHTSVDGRQKDDDNQGISFNSMEYSFGANVYSEFRLSEKWSLFFSATGTLNFMGTYRYEEYTENKYDFTSTYQKNDTGFGGFAVSPKIGVSFRY